MEGLRSLLKGGVAVDRREQILEIQRSLPHGHVAAVLGTLRSLRLDRLLSGGKAARAWGADPEERRLRDLALALVVARVTAPGSKLATLRALDPETSGSSLVVALGLEAVETREIYAALDWLGARQERIERWLARKHLSAGTLVLLDVTSSYLEGLRPRPVGLCCELAQ